MIITNKYFRNFSLLLILLCLTSITDARAQDSDEKSGEITNANTLERVENSRICMPMNKLFQDEQISVTIEGKTYYGCCQGCVNKLKKNPATRTAIDPVSEKKVNKAEAVVGANPDGKVYYFESVANMKKFEPESDSGKSSDDEQ